MKTIVFEVDELECTSCANTVLKELSKRGIDNADVDVFNKTVTIEYDESKYTPSDLTKIIKSAGFDAEIVEE